MKLYVAMVGLPARGKSTLAKRIRSGLEQQGIRTAIFNNGELRRMLFGLESGSAEFFNPDNTRAQRLRDQITHQNMERARAWLDEGGDVAIIDATNGTVHQRVDLSATLRDRPVLFIECVNDDPLLLDASIRRKTRLPEFANMTQEEALESFRKRLAYYESVYTPVRKERCWIRVDAVDSAFRTKPRATTSRIMRPSATSISSRWVQDLYLVRHGETDYNREGPPRRGSVFDRQGDRAGRKARRAFRRRGSSVHFYIHEAAFRRDGRAAAAFASEHHQHGPERV